MIKAMIFNTFPLLIISLLISACNGFHYSTQSLKLLNVRTTGSAYYTARKAAAGPATIERDATVIRTGRSGPAVLDRPSTTVITTTTTTTKELDRRRPIVRQFDGDKTWEVRIYNDGENTREHVARSLVQITGMAEVKAYRTMMQAHQTGMASVGRFCFEIAETYNDGLQKQGIVSDIVPVDEEK